MVESTLVHRQCSGILSNTCEPVHHQLIFSHLGQVLTFSPANSVLQDGICLQGKAFPVGLVVSLEVAEDKSSLVLPPFAQ